MAARSDGSRTVQAHRLAVHLLTEKALFGISLDTPTGPSVLVAEVPTAEYVPLVAHDLVARTGVPSTDGDGIERTMSIYPDRAWPVVVFSRDGSSRLHIPERGNRAVASALAVGSSIIGISPSPKRHLPRALLEATDRWLAIPGLDPDTLTKVVAGVIKRPVRRVFLDEHACRSLSLEDLCIAIRPGSSAADCVLRLRRLAAARAAPPTSGPSLADLHGLGEARAWGEALSQDIAAYRKAEIEWDAVDRGALLAGPPGTGKTTFARALAVTCDVPMVCGSLATWQAAGTLDALLRAMRKDFDIAKASAPSLLFIDELDSFGDRSTFDHRHRDYSIQVVNALLEQLDGIEGRDGVVVIGACNYPGLIDPGILRSGRLERVIYLALPGVEDLAAILRYYLLDDLPAQDLTPAALAAEGSTGADIERWVREARRTARQAARPLAFRDLLEAISEKAAHMSPGARRVAAYHEAGHSIVGLHFGDSIARVSIIAAGSAWGSTRGRADWRGAQPTRSMLRKRLRVLLGGRAAEELAFKEPSVGSGGAPDSDLAIATGIAVAMETSFGFGRTATLAWRGPPEIAAERTLLAHDAELAARVSEELAAAYADAIAILKDRRRELDAVARALIRDSYLDGAEIGRIVTGCRPMKTARGRRRDSDFVPPAARRLLSRSQKERPDARN
jgi:cell division protease FtsH